MAPRVQRAFFHDLIRKTENFGHLTWLGEPIWQNVLDLWTTQEVIGRIKPDLLIECGTFKGGSSRFFANLFDLMDHGRCITIDVEEQSFPRHERVTYLHGSTMDPEILEQVEQAVSGTDGPVMVILDDNHSEQHVRRELESYSAFVSTGSYLLVQDGVIDVLNGLDIGSPGPLPAIRDFLRTHSEFVVDRELTEKFLITHHPDGWLRRTR